VKAIDEAEDLINAMQEPDDPQRRDIVPEPATAQYKYGEGAFVLVPPAVAAAGQNIPVGKAGEITVGFAPAVGQTVKRDSPGRAVVTEVRFGGIRGTAQPIYEQWIKPNRVLNCPVVRLSEPPPLFESKQAVHDWIAERHKRKKDWLAVIFPEQAGDSSTTRLAWMLLRPTGDGLSEPVRTFVSDDSGRNARMPGLQNLPTKRVTIVGCGSMGSKIAAGLSAAGVGTFRFLDGDFMEPDNAVRHECGVPYFGWPKTAAVANRILEVNPQAIVASRIDAVIGGINSTEVERAVYESVESCDLIVETTGDHGVSRFIMDVASETSTPQLYASVTNGAWAGEIVRVVPSETACWLCWLTQYENSQPPTEPTPAAGVFAPGCDQPTFTGTGYEVGVVANLACAMAVDTLLRADQRPHFAGNYIRWRMRNSDGELQPAVEVLPTEKQDVCPYCRSV
jgi:molybdopterin/thiamine biosynthesis adenylyltransferase